jgi:hypothetical protein
MKRMMEGMPRSAASGARIASLIVLLPSSDMLAAGGWEATPMPFALLGRKGEMLRAGHARFDALPQAGETALPRRYRRGMVRVGDRTICRGGPSARAGCAAYPLYSVAGGGFACRIGCGSGG